VAFCALAASCSAGPPPRPLDHAAAVAHVRAERAPAVAPAPLAQAAERMRSSNPAIREARAAWVKATAVAGIPTPGPNPTVSLGPLLLGGADILQHATWGMEAALGWTAVLGGRLRLQDDLNRLEAEAAAVRLAAVVREEYLALRRAWVDAALTATRVARHESLAATAREAADLGRRMVEAGQAESVDARLLGLDAARFAADTIDAEERRDDALGTLAARIGVDPEGVVPPAPLAVPPPPGSVPDRATLEGKALEHHPRLALLRAEYGVAEKALRLEVARGVPDLDLGPTFEREGAENRLGLPFSIEVPLVDRNQVGIARACAAREEARVRYEAALQRILASVASAHARLLRRHERLARLQTDVEPAARGTLEAMRAALAAGAGDTLRFVEVLRAERDVALALVGARARLHEAWSDLEEAAGLPLRDVESPADADVQEVR
jgi:outer membrane protein TolC